MPVYTIEYQKTIEWTVYASSREEAEKAAKSDSSAERDAVSDAELVVTVYGERELTEKTVVDVVVDGESILNPGDVEWFDQYEIIEKEKASKREAEILAKNLNLFEGADL